MLEGFKLLELKIIHNEKKIFDINFLNPELEYSSDELFSSVVIGSNGSGKSYLLTLIAEVFRMIENKIKRASKEISQRYEQYHIRYSLHNDIYEVNIVGNHIEVYINTKKSEIKKIQLPSTILAVSFMVNDKFIFQSEEERNNSIYNYLGVRRTSNATWTTSITKSIIDIILENLDNEKSLEIIGSTLDFLKYRKEIILKFDIVNKSFFNDSKLDSLVNRMERRIERIENQNSFRRESLSKLNKQSLENISYFILQEQNKETHNQELNNKKHKISELNYKINLNNSSSDSGIKENYNFLQALIDLKMIKSPNLLLSKNDNVLEDDYFEFENASSGEKQFLFTMINIASKIQNDSLVLIDEPELSFHPNWQMVYVNYIKQLFSSFSGCHFILATHSHYILSDLKPKSSSIISIFYDVESKQRESELINYDVYAWSAENILYNVFKVRTTRNYYFEEDLKKLLRLISTKSENTGELNSLVNKLNQYVFDDSDPVKLVLSQADIYLKKKRSSEI